MNEKVAVTPELMVELLELSIQRGTQNKAIDVAIEWIQTIATKHRELKEECDKLKQFRNSVFAKIHENAGNIACPFAYMSQPDWDTIKSEMTKLSSKEQSAERGE